MREIKFRAWDTEEKKFEGYFQLTNTGTLAVFDPMIAEWDKAKDERYIVMQYTGLKDKNKNDCYEGDLIEFEEPVFESDILTCPVVFKDGAFCAEWEKENGSMVTWFLLSDLEEFEILGNIYEDKG